MGIANKQILSTREATIEWVDSKLNDSITKFQDNRRPRQVQFRKLCSNWEWAKRSDVYTHYLHRYPAKLLPYIPIFFLSSSLVSKKPLLDPFAGTGTVAVEGILHRTNPVNCKLVEINPLARLISSAKTTPLDPVILRGKTDEILRIIEGYSAADVKIPQFPGIDFWFRKESQTDLAIIRHSIELLDADLNVKDFFWACFSSIIRDMSRADPKISPPVILSAGKLKGYSEEERKQIIGRKRRYKAINLFKAALTKNIARMQDLWDAWQLTGKNSTVVGHDARELTVSPYLGKGILKISEEKKLPQNSIGMVITSPPYINAQKYTRTTKLELWWLGLIEPDLMSIHEYDRTLVGTEKVPYIEYSKIQNVENPRADKFIQKIYDIDPRKAGIISKYFIDMRKSLKEIFRVLTPGGWCVFVVGNNLVLGETIKNNRILAEIGEDEGLVLKTMMVDEIRSRGLITRRHETAGMIADEWILLFQKRLEKEP